MLVGKGKNIGIGVGLGILGFFIFVFVAGTMMIQEEEMMIQEEEMMIQEEEQELRNMSNEELLKNAVSWEYDDILRNIEKYEGKIIGFEGEIFRAETISEGHYVLTVREGGGLDIFVVDYTGSRVLSGDTIRVYAVVEKIVEVGSMLASDWKTPYPLVKAIRLACINC